MQRYRLDASHLLLFDPDAHRSTVHAAFADPSPLEESTLGRAFLLIEIDSRDPANDAFITTVQNTFFSGYYRGSEFSLESAFERALQLTNERVQEVVGERVADILPRLHLTLGIVHDTKLHFTVIGRLHAFLFHRQRIVDVLAASAGGDEQPTPLKMFTTIVSGELTERDALFFCTTSVLDHLSQEKIKRMVVDHSPEETTQLLESMLAETDGPTPFATLTLKIAAVEEPVAEKAERVIPDLPFADIHKPQDSMNELIQRERQTNQLLTPSLWPNVGGMFKGKRGASTRDDDMKSSAHETPGSPFERQELNASTPSGLSITLAQIGRWSMKGLRLVGTGLLALANAIAAMVQRRPRGSKSSFARSTNRRLASGASWMANLAPHRRRLFLAMLILLVLFAQSVVSVGKRREQKLVNESYRTALAAAKEKITASDAALLIRNESGARRLLTEAAEQLARVPENVKATSEERGRVAATLQEKQASIRHVVQVSPDTVADLTTLDVGAVARGLLPSDGALYAYNLDTDSVYKVPTNGDDPEFVVDSPSLSSHIVATVPGKESTLLFLQGDGNLQELNLGTKKLSTVTVGYANVDRDVRAAYFYNNRLYTLDAKNNGIFRHDKETGGYSKGTAWLNSNHPDVTNGTALAVDGALYVLGSDGAILKFANGASTDITFDAADPALTDPTDFWVSTTLPTLFVLDAKNARIIEYNKEGTFLRQYAADSFRDATAFTIVDSVIYVLTGSRVVSVPVSSE